VVQLDFDDIGFLVVLPGEVVVLLAVD